MGLLMSGHYTFMEYSALHWLRHFESAMSAMPLVDESAHDITHVAESLGVFLDLHWANPTATLPVPKSTKDKMRIFRDYPFYDRLLQAVTSTRKQLSFFGELKPAITALDIFDTLRSIRQAMETSTLNDDQETQDRVKVMFGVNFFKCPRPSCHFFSNGFESSQLRDVHVRKHFRSIPCPFEGCPHLKIGFSNDKDLQKHLEQTHPMGFNIVDFPTDAELLNDVDPEQVDEAFVNPFDFAGPREPEPASSRKRRKVMEYICPVCSKVFSKNYNLKSHMITHSPDKPFNCEHCDLQFARPSDLKRHQTSHVEGIYRCHGIATDGTSWGCNEVFKRADGLKDHWRSLKSCRPVSASTPTDLPFRSVGSDQPENRLTES